MFRAIIFDYDGTLVSTRARFCPPESAVAAELARLLKSGVTVAIATGRGGSVREALRKILPAAVWKRTVVGYYNGGEIGRLSDPEHPNQLDVGTTLTPLANALRASPLAAIATQCDRRYQISLRPKENTTALALWELASEITQRCGLEGVRVVRSSHSVDLLAPGVSKTSVVTHLIATGAATKEQVLAIGDCGRRPGNDFDLLSASLSLSVDEVSRATETCWNLASPGTRGTQATLEYCRALESSGDGSFRCLAD